MNHSFKVFGLLLGGTLFFNVAMNFMGDNIADFENMPLPPKKVRLETTQNPTMKIDAMSRDAWRLVDFSTGKTHLVEDIENHPERAAGLDWDIGFQRTKIITNSGETNPKGKVAATNLGKIDFDKVIPLPANTFTQDVRKWGNVSNPALSDWYLYRTRTHNIESKKNVYVVRTGEGGHLKMRILNYYCNRPESECKTGMCTRDEAACLTVEYQYIDPGEKRFPKPDKETPLPTQEASVQVH